MAHRKSDAERGPFGAWAYKTRTELDLSVEQVMPMLPTNYHPATLRKIEGGSTPMPPTRMWRELGNLYSRLAAERHVPIDAQPSIAPEPAQVAEGTDAAAAAIDRQTAVMERQVAAMERQAELQAEILTELRLLIAGQKEQTLELGRSVGAIASALIPPATPDGTDPVFRAGTGR